MLVEPLVQVARGEAMALDAVRVGAAGCQGPNVHSCTLGCGRLQRLADQARRRLHAPPLPGLGLPFQLSALLEFSRLLD